MVRLDDLTEAYFMARANKRRSNDSVRFEVGFETGLVRLMHDINNRTYRADSNYAFVVFSPKPREIFATEMRNRVVHHYLDWRLRPIYEKVFSDRTFNNRTGMGLHKAVASFRNDVREMTADYMKDAWIAHLDIKGYFPNANVEIALRQQLDLIENNYEGEDKDDLKYMMTECMRADPARHCDVFVPRTNWSAIAPEKSLFNKPVGVGGAIGFLCWQNAMGLYINDVVKWLQGHSFLHVTVFVDDIYVVTSDKPGFLALMPDLRSRLAGLDVQLNEKKFYMQHYSKGVMMLGTMLKFDRKYANRGTVARGFRRLREWASMRRIRKADMNRMLCSLNTYCGIFKGHNNRKQLEQFKDEALRRLGRYVKWNESKKCFNLIDSYNDYLISRYAGKKAVKKICPRLTTTRP